MCNKAEQQWNRIQGVKMVHSGIAVTEVAKFFNVSTRSVFGWVAKFAQSGPTGLLAKGGAGRPPKMSVEQMRWIGQLIEREFNMRLSLPTLGKIMAQLGFTAQRPLHRAYEQDARLVQDWMGERLPALRRHARALGAQLLFADEASMRSDYHAGTTWAPQGRTPIVRATGQRHSVNMISAISSNGELQFMLVDGRSNAQVFKQFLQQLMLDAQAPIILIVDGHPIHKANVVKEYVASTKGRLELHYLPPYSPQLNPDEQVWKNVKERTAKQFPSDKWQLRAFLKNALERLQQMPEIVRGFFAHPECGFVN